MRDFGVRRPGAALVRGGLTPVIRENVFGCSRDRSRMAKALTGQRTPKGLNAVLDSNV